MHLTNDKEQTMISNDLKKTLAWAASVLTALAVVAAEPRPVTMMSLNIRMGCGLRDPFKLPEGGLGYLPQCAKVIREANPDWVAIQEIDRCSLRAGHVDQTAELSRLCGMKGTFVKKTPEKDGDYGLAILSKEEPLAVSKILVPGFVHTRCLMVVEFRDYIVVCTHFPRKDHLCDVAADIARLNLTGHGKPVFLAGDLNSEPGAKAISILKKGFTILTDVTQPTFPADAPRVCIDYIMVDKEHADAVEVTERRVIAAPEATDHCGLVVKAKLKVL